MAPQSSYRNLALSFWSHNKKSSMGTTTLDSASSSSSSAISKEAGKIPFEMMKEEDESGRSQVISDPIVSLSSPSSSFPSTSISSSTLPSSASYTSFTPQSSVNAQFLSKKNLWSNLMQDSSKDFLKSNDTSEETVGANQESSLQLSLDSDGDQSENTKALFSSLVALDEPEDESVSVPDYFKGMLNNFTETLRNESQSIDCWTGNDSNSNRFSFSNRSDCLLFNSNETFSLDFTTYNVSDSSNITASDFDEKPEKVYWALLLFLLPVLAVFGNILVILSVYREKSLHNVTNYFIVNLAFADLLVAGVVMPFAVYYLVNIDWELSQSLCDFWIAVDVLCSTASILNLVAISVDRFIAVTNPIKYAKHKSGKRVSFTIGFVWLVSATIASPIVFGLNNTPDRQPTLCIFYNSDFIIYSSLGSFYIPCLLMIYLYYRIFKAIHERTKRNAELNGKRQQLQHQRLPATEPSKAKQSSSSRSAGSNHSALVIENASNVTSYKDLEPDSNKKTNVLSTGRFKSKGKSNERLDNKEKQQIRLLVVTEAKHYVTNIGSMDSREEEDEEDEEDEDDYDSNECKVIKNKQVVCETPIGSEEIESKGVNKETTKHDYGKVIVNIEEISDEDGFKMKMETLVTNPRVASSEMDRLQTTGVVETSATVRATETSRTQSSNLSDSMCTKNETQAKESKKRKSRFNLGRKAKKGKLKREKASAKRERKATKTLAIVLGVFLFCWVPFFTCNIMDAICIKLESEDCKLGMTAFLLTTWLGYINSCANPVIYTIFNPEFRKAFKKILTQPCGKR